MSAEGNISDDGICFACGRFAGRADVCIYCDADMPVSSIRVLCRRWGLLAILAALALLWLWSGTKEARPIRAGQITPRMNYGLVRISGEVISRPYVRVDGEEGYVSFLLSDGTGSVRVSMTGRTALEFASDERAARKGAALTVTGILSVKKGQDKRLFVKPVKGEQSWVISI